MEHRCSLNKKTQTSTCTDGGQLVLSAYGSAPSPYFYIDLHGQCLPFFIHVMGCLLKHFSLHVVTSANSHVHDKVGPLVVWFLSRCVNYCNVQSRHVDVSDPKVVVQSMFGCSEAWGRPSGPLSVFSFSACMSSFWLTQIKTAFFWPCLICKGR